MKFHPTNPNKMYAISARGGLFITSDAGTSWNVTPGTDFMPSARLASVCIDFTNDQVIYLGTGDHDYYYSGIGVYKSTDGGNTFSYSGLSGKMIVEMIMDPTNQNIIVAATNAGIYKTTDAGITWTLKSSSRQFDDLKLKENSSTRTMFAATTDSAFFRSTNFGETWTQINNGIVLPSGVTNGNGVRIGLTPADSNVVYLALVANGGMIYKSTNGGTSFTAQKNTSAPYISYYTNSSSSSGQGDYNHGIGVDRNNPNILWYVAHCVWKSSDGGLTWTQQTNWWASVHTDMHQICESPYNSSLLYNMNDGGVWLSTDGGTTWNPKSNGIYGYEIYHGNCSPTQRDIVSIGTQDNGELYSNAGGWLTNRGGDWSSQCSFDYRPASSMVYYHENNKRRLVNGSDATYGLPTNVTMLQDIAFHRSNPSLAFVGDTVILRTTNLTATTPTWTQIANLNKKIMAMHSSFADPNRLYVITSDATIYVSTNALSATPTFTSYPLPNSTSSAATITSIKSSPNTLYLSANTKVYRSVDNGATWTNITYNLPSVNHRRIIADEYFSSNELVFIASNNTVYYKLVGNASWTIFNQNLPSRTSVIDLSIYNDSTANTILRVATYGRGVWQSPISGLHELSANFASNNSSPCQGVAVQFSDLSTGNPISWSWTFPGGTPASSTSENPIVTYTASGTYDVTLTCADGSTNSTLTKTAYISTVGSNLPLTEDFEGAGYPPADWTEFDDGSDGAKWQPNTSVSGYGIGAKCIYFDNWSQNSNGKKDEIRTARYSGDAYQSITLSFDVAYWSYTTQSYQDTLVVLISTDCGATYNPIYTKGGAVLSTVPGNSTSSFTPTSTQWRTETISLNAYIGQNFMLAFRNIGRYGNNLYVDNISVNSSIAVNAGLDATICAGTSTSIGSAPTPGINYSWSPTTALSSATISNPVASPLSNYDYILTATHATSGISSSDTVLVTVIPNTVSISGGIPSSLCKNISLNIPFTVNCNFNPGNIFTAELSDASGSFVSPLTISTLTGTGSGTINGFIPSGLASGNAYRIRIKTSAPVSTSTDNGFNIDIQNCTFPYTVKLFIQGYYVGGGLMRAAIDPVLYPTTCDTVRIELHDAVSPYSMVENITGTVAISGIIAITLPSYILGQTYYLVIKHRNALETWSANPITFNSGGFYNFTAAGSQAYGSNQVAIGPGQYALYSGDISDGITAGISDGQIDTSDYNELQISLGQFLSNYDFHDLTGDFVVETMDFSLIENNIHLNVFVKKP
jgi:PKD repeat protein